MKPGMNKRDFIAIFLILAICAFWFSLLDQSREKGTEAVIYVNGEIYAYYPIDINREEIIECDGGYNKVIINNSQVYISDADCPDKYCVSQGKISNSGASLVCLPHKLVVEIRSDSEENHIDAVAK